MSSQSIAFGTSGASGAPERPSGKLVPSTGLWVALVAGVVALPFLGSLGYGFVFDDDAHIVQNPAIQSWRGVLAYFFRSKVGHGVAALMNYNYYRPLFYLWFRVNHALFGLNPAGWHAATLALHLVASVLAFFLLRRYFSDPWIAAAGAVIFGVHPAHVESVAWVSGANDSLVAVAIFGCLLLRRRDMSPSGALRQTASLLCYGAALFIKEIAIVVPALIFLYSLLYSDGYDSGAKDAIRATKRVGSIAKAIRNVLPFVGVSAVYFAARIAMLGKFRAGSPWLSRSSMLLSVPSVFLFYMRHLLWPAKLSILYDFAPAAGAQDPRFLPSLLVILIAAAAACYGWLRTRNNAIPLAAAWIILFLLPVLDIAFFQKDDCVHDRYLYLPAFGLAIGVCALLKAFADSGVPAKRFLAAGFVVLVVPALALSTALQSRPWRNDISLYTRALQTSNNIGARINLASEYAKHDRLQEAADLLNPVAAQAPDNWLASYNLGYVNYRLKNTDLAERSLLRAIALDPTDANQYSILGLVDLREGKLDDASERFHQALSRDPSLEGCHLALGLILIGRDPQAAQAEFLQELKNHPDDLVALQQLNAVTKALSLTSANVQPPQHP